MAPASGDETTILLSRIDGGKYEIVTKSITKNTFQRKGKNISKEKETAIWSHSYKQKSRKGKEKERRQ